MEMDLFEHYDLVPSNIQDIVSKYDEEFEGNGDAYAICERFIKELELNGYTADYALDGIPFGLKTKNTKIEK